MLSPTTHPTATHHDQAAMNPKNTLYDVKRIIGRAWNDGVVQDEKKQFPFKMTESDQVRVTQVHAFKVNRVRVEFLRNSTYTKFHLVRFPVCASAQKWGRMAAG